MLTRLKWRCVYLPNNLRIEKHKPLKTKKTTPLQSGLSDPARTRTWDRQLRRLLLYPTELLDQKPGAKVQQIKNAARVLRLLIIELLGVVNGNDSLRNMALLRVTWRNSLKSLIDTGMQAITQSLAETREDPQRFRAKHHKTLPPDAAPCDLSHP